MSDQSRPEIPLDIEQVVTGLSQLGTVLGVEAATTLPALNDQLRRAMAARDRGDPRQALEHIAAAMGLLAQAAQKLDPKEAALMQAVLQRFRDALQRFDETGAKRLADEMFERSGAVWKKS